MSTIDPGGVHVPAGAGRALPIRRMGVTLRVASDATDGSVAILEHVLPPGYVAMPLHRHRNETETTCVLEGTLTVRVGEETMVAGPGACVVKPRGVFHTFWNAGEHPVRFLEVISPGGLERYYEEISRLIPASGPVEIERILALAGGYGVEFDMTSLLDIMEANPVRLV